MAWQRKIPFGYQIKDGERSSAPAEAEAVRDIFTRYLAGASYAKIAEAMTDRGIPYHQHTPQWNKNMVKRILENEVYLGGKGYPRLVDGADFLAVRFQRQDRNTYAPCPDCLHPIREKAVCGCCGARLRRRYKDGENAVWRCDNPACGASVRVTDAGLRANVLKQLHDLAEHPELLILPDTPRAALSPDGKRIENEINLSFNRQDIDPELMKTLICALAAERYAALPDPTPAYKLERVRQRLEQQAPAQEADLWELLDAAVRAIRIGKDGAVTLELAAGPTAEQRKESA